MSDAVTDISLTDVRCFSGEQHARLAKITLLVGENSVGKTTLLGCLNALGRLAGLYDLQDRINWFDQDPFGMGSFDTIARSGSRSFRVAIGLAGSPIGRFAIEFEPGAEVCPRETFLDLHLSGSRSKTARTLTIRREAAGSPAERWRFAGPGFRFSLDRSEVSWVQFSTWLSQAIGRGILPFAGELMLFQKRVADTTNRDSENFARFVSFFRHGFRAPDSPLRIEPIRPHGLLPRRFYTFDPVGGPNGRDSIHSISEAGRQLGMFDRLEVRQRGREEFEVLVDVAGSSRNIMDVGYGVSSLLPFLKVLANAAPNSLFLLQQPEVHIHPSAQKRFIEMLAKSDHAFVIETHSNHVIRWLRILVKEGRLSPSEVSIIYFEPGADDPSATCLHQISLDSLANLSGQPPGYGEFLSEETSRLLGFHP